MTTLCEGCSNRLGDTSIEKEGKVKWIRLRAPLGSATAEKQQNGWVCMRYASEGHIPVNCKKHLMVLCETE